MNRLSKKEPDLSMHDFLQTCIKELESMSNRGILSGMGELLDAQQKEWVKQNYEQIPFFY